ncbi:hypothetical protein KC887_04870 [Candidatus Kaiserbacteria bacterium]|nr:hypothetical protein [Candidatus Kaiserbacteria bacterium]
MTSLRFMLTVWFFVGAITVVQSWIDPQSVNMPFVFGFSIMNVAAIGHQVLNSFTVITEVEEIK